MNVIWITGASTGIGRAVALEYAARGWTVAATARTVEALDALHEQNSRIHPFPGDVTVKDDMQRIAEDIKQRFGHLDIALLNAGTHYPTDGHTLTRAPYEKLFEINVMGVVDGLCAAVPLFQRQGYGHVAIVSSVAGWRGLPGASAYCATKAALVALAESLKFDFDEQNIVISLIQPGFVRTPLTDRNTFPMPFLLEPEDAAKRIADGLSKKRFLITFPKRLSWPLQLLRLLPYCAYFPLVRSGTRGKRKT